MRTVGAFEAKTHFSALLEAVVSGEQIVITRHGAPVARLVPETGRDTASAAAAAEAILAGRGARRLDGLDWRELRDAGRR